jgi:hypothetical protein
MKPTARDHQLAVAFGKDECAYLLELLAGFHPARWFHRKKINSIPTGTDPTSDYYFCGDRQQDKVFSEYLKSLAPVIEGGRLAEWCINRYEVGGYMPEHVDIAQYRFNVVVALCDNGDGITVEGTFIQDVPGQALVFPARSAPHAVPPVKHRRYVAIYLYE